MTDDTATHQRIELTYEDFVTGIFVTLHQRGITRMIPPELDEFNYSDKAAVATFNHLEEFPDVKARFFQTFCNHGAVNEHSCEWQRALHELGPGLFYANSATCYLEILGKPFPRWERPGNDAMWDELTDVFCEVAKPILL